MKNNLLTIIALLLLIGCEKEISIRPKNGVPTIAVDASIENGQPPIVILTNSFNYFSTLSLADLNNAFVKDAVVKLSDGTRTIQLKQYAIPLDSSTLYFYSVDNTDPGNAIIGQYTGTYFLNIEANGKTYTSSTTIPPLAKTLDSLWWRQAPDNPDTSRTVVFGRLTDPPGLGNYLRYYTSRNDSAFLPGFNSIYDDNVVDGVTYDIQIDKGVNRNEPFNEEEYGYFRRGDTVDVKIANIDKATFDFWRTWEQNQSTLGNPFSVPVKILGNISNGGLGYFGGYGTQTRRIIIPK